MFCRNCAREIDDKAEKCTGCGLNPVEANNYCNYCGAYYERKEAYYCLACNRDLLPIGWKSRITAGLLAIFLGFLGAHKFDLGQYGVGVAMMAISVIGSLFTGGFALYAMMLVGVIEGVIYLTRSKMAFYRTYVVDGKDWF